MPIQVDWYEKGKQNICCHMFGNWRWDELPVTFQEVVDLLDTVDYRVNVIIDLTETERFPAFQISEMRQVANAPSMSHPNSSEFLVVGIQKYMIVMYKVFKQIFPQAAARYKLFHSFDEMNNYLSSPAIK